jgi:uncharacterized protein (DUF488 family)
MVAIYTIGHSTRPLEEFLGLLRAHGVELLADIRSVPRSRRNPQFNHETLPESLSAAGISYAHLKALGGLRRPRRDSPNTAWRTDGFRGYADYMETAEFEAGLQTLLELAGLRQTAVMCAEAVWWRCHRQLLSDALLARGVAVEHLLSESRREPHRLTPYARVEGTRITYPGIMGAL